MSNAQLGAVAAGETTPAEAALVRRLAASDPAVAARLRSAEALESALRSDTLLPLPLGLVTRILDRVRDEGAIDDGTHAGSAGGGTRVRTSGSRSRREWIAIAAGAILALGAGVGGLWTVAGSGDLGALVGAAADPATDPDVSPVASLASLAGEARTSTHAAVSSLASVPARMPGSPAALGLGAITLLGAAVVGARRSARNRTGPTSAADRESEGRDSEGSAS